MGDRGLPFLFVLLVVSFSSPRDADNLSLRFENVCISRRGLLFYCTSFWNLHVERLLMMQNNLFSSFVSTTMTLLRKVQFSYFLWYCYLLFLSCNFTKKRPSKICEIEKINRQTHNKNVLIFTK